MKGFFSNISPRRAVVDLWQVLGAPNEYRVRALVLAGCVTGGIFYLMVQQEGRGLPPPPKVIYFESWRADRSDKEIIAGNIAATKKARAEEAAEEQRAEDIRQMYKAVGAATGIDTDKMYREGKAEREAIRKAERERAERIIRQSADGTAPQPAPDPAAPARAPAPTPALAPAPAPAAP